MKIGQKIREIRLAKKLTLADVEYTSGLASGNLSRVERGAQWLSEENLFAIAKALNVPAAAFFTDTLNMDHYSVGVAGESTQETGQIEYWNARGSCGGGFMNDEQLPKGFLVKEISFFTKYETKPSNLFAVYADGDSMSDYIVDGDMVIFDKTRTTPVGGKIFLVDHPEGLRIKRLRREIDSAWLLESLNPDKRRFPDERIPPDHLDLLKICGQFVYRQGG